MNKILDYWNNYEWLDKNRYEIKTLIETIKEEIVKGKQRIEYTIENEKTGTNRTIGKYIHKHLLKYNDRADYGDELYKLLAIE